MNKFQFWDLWFKKKETLDGYSEDSNWLLFPTAMYTRKPTKGEKVNCGTCGKKIKRDEYFTMMSAGSIQPYCDACFEIARDNLISQCPTCYLGSFEEYKEWKRKHD